MATIATVAPGTPITSAWGNSVATELNANTVKKAGATMTGPLTITAAPGLILRRSGDSPYLQFQTTTGTNLAHIGVNSSGDLYYETDVAGSQHVWTINGNIRARLDSAGHLFLQEGLTLLGTLDMNGYNVLARAGVFARNDDANQIVIADYDAGTAGAAAHAFISFFPDATSTTAFGSRGAYVGFNGEGMQVQADIGQLTLQSVAAGIVVQSATAVVVNPADSLYVGKSTADPDTVGTEIFTATHATTSVRGTIRNTVAGAGVTNLYLRRTSSADADNQVFVDFTRAAGTRIGSISQNGTAGVTYGTTSDYRLKDDLGPIDDPAGKIAALAPKHLAWKDGSGAFDGFLAHEVAAVVPYAVQGVKDAVFPPDDPTNPGGIDPQQLDLGQLVPVLVAAVQDLTARVATLEAAAP